MGEELYVNHLLADGVSHIGAQGNNANELENASDEASTAVGEGARADSVGERVGDVVGADGVGVKERPEKGPGDETLVEEGHANLGRVDLLGRNRHSGGCQESEREHEASHLGDCHAYTNRTL